MTTPPIKFKIGGVLISIFAVTWLIGQPGIKVTSLLSLFQAPIQGSSMAKPPEKVILSPGDKMSPGDSGDKVKLSPSPKNVTSVTTSPEPTKTVQLSQPSNTNTPYAATTLSPTSMVTPSPLVTELIVTPTVTQTSSPLISVTSTKININTADKSSLMTLWGIGETKAAAVILYRETTGPFKSVEDIMEVKGIGQKTFDKIRDLITI